MRFRPMGDRAIMIEWGNQIDPEVHGRVQRFCDALKQAAIAGVEEWVPAYSGVTIFYHPSVIRYDELIAKLGQLGDSCTGLEKNTERIVIIPTLYGGKWGPDLTDVARVHQLTEQEVIHIHTRPDYLVYMMGFVPGFAYLGGMSSRIATPRLPTPRAKIPAGSVGIAGGQTGIYPLSTPGGWRIIGQTPIPLFQPEREPPVLLRMGDRIRFRAIEEEEFRELEQKCQQGECVVETFGVEGERDETKD